MNETFCKYFIPFPYYEKREFIRWKLSKILETLGFTFTDWMIIFYNPRRAVQGYLFLFP